VTPKLRRPSPGTALGFLALIVALVGTANAGQNHVIVRRGDIAKGAVTANALAKGAVKSRALAANAVTSKALKNDAVSADDLASGSVTPRVIATGAVGSSALAPNAVTSPALAPGSVYAGALGPVELKTAPLVDHDEAADLSTWTNSGSASALCAPGQRVLGGGVEVTNPGNRRVAIIRSVPFSTAVDGFSGEITTDSGGTAVAQVEAICLK
jgi:hypothetical protein